MLRDDTRYLEKWVDTYQWKPQRDLPPGDYAFWVRGWNNLGYGRWSNITFSIEYAPPGPIRDVQYYEDRIFGEEGFSKYFHSSIGWDVTTNTYWYQIWVGNEEGEVVNKWVDLDDYYANDLYPYDIAEEDGRVYFGKEDGGFSAGNYEYWIRSCNAAGMGTWTGPFGFIVSDLG